jgi:hypothetical protein
MIQGIFLGENRLLIFGKHLKSAFFTGEPKPIMPRPAYHGQVEKLVLAFDLGTTFSGASYAILEPDITPEIRGVTRYDERHMIYSYFSSFPLDFPPKMLAVMRKSQLFYGMINEAKSGPLVQKPWNRKLSRARRIRAGWKPNGKPDSPCGKEVSLMAYLGSSSYFALPK